MIKRIVEISNPSKLSVKYKQLKIQQNNIEIGSVPIEDLGVLIINEPSIITTQKLIIECIENNVSVIFCNEKHMPSGIVIPLCGNSLQSQILKHQINLNEPQKKRLWQLIVKEKIKQQSLVLKITNSNYQHLQGLIPKVRSGDPSNIEALAAKYYWSYLFKENFRRVTESEGINSLLNYGYAIIRSAVARAIVAAGLNPTIGIHHKNKYNPFCLVDDLIEPLRPRVDLTVWKMIYEYNFENELNKITKVNLIEILCQECTISSEQIDLLLATQKYVVSFRKFLQLEIAKLEFPSL